LDTTANKESMLNVSQMTYSTLNNSQMMQPDSRHHVVPFFRFTFAVAVIWGA